MIDTMTVRPQKSDAFFLDQVSGKAQDFGMLFSDKIISVCLKQAAHALKLINRISMSGQMAISFNMCDDKFLVCVCLQKLYA